MSGFLTRHKIGLAAGGLLAVPVASLLCLLLVALLLVGGNATPAAAGCALPIGAGGVSPASLSTEQTANARTIIDVGMADNVPAYGWVVAVAAAMTESGLHNLDHGDRDSVGLFQQRPSQGWGTLAQIMDPAYASAAFYGGPNPPTNRGLRDIAGWQQMDVPQQPRPSNALPSRPRTAAGPNSQPPWSPTSPARPAGARPRASPAVQSAS